MNEIRWLFETAGSSSLLTGVGLALALGALLYLKRMEYNAEKNVIKRIRAEYLPAFQPQVIKIYRELKLKELEGLFLKILDEARGDLGQVRKLASVAENVGWQAFLDDQW